MMTIINYELGSGCDSVGTASAVRIQLSAKFYNEHIYCEVLKKR